MSARISEHAPASETKCSVWALHRRVEFAIEEEAIGVEGIWIGVHNLKEVRKDPDIRRALNDFVMEDRPGRLSIIQDTKLDLGNLPDIRNDQRARWYTISPILILNCQKVGDTWMTRSQ
jgi:hypothetical protein